MNSRSWLKVLFITAVMVWISSAAWGQHPGKTTGPKYDKANEVKIKGVIVEVREVPGEFEGLHLVVKTDTKTVLVHVAPSEFLKEIASPPVASTRPSASRPGCGSASPARPTGSSGESANARATATPPAAAPIAAARPTPTAIIWRRLMPSARRAAVGGFDKAQPDQHLPEHQHADDTEESGEQPQGDGLQVDRTLGIGGLRGERNAPGVQAAGQVGQ